MLTKVSNAPWFALNLTQGDAGSLEMLNDILMESWKN